MSSPAQRGEAFMLCVDVGESGHRLSDRHSFLTRITDSRAQNWREASLRCSARANSAWFVRCGTFAMAMGGASNQQRETQTSVSVSVHRSDSRARVLHTAFLHSAAIASPHPRELYSQLHSREQELKTRIRFPRKLIPFRPA